MRNYDAIVSKSQRFRKRDDDGGGGGYDRNRDGDICI